MIIAREKKANNIAEYLIYMFQVEDMVRASGLKIETIENSVISQFQVSDEEKEEIRKWYQGLIEMLIEEKKVKTGHLQFIINTLNDLYNFHLLMLNNSSDAKYREIYQEALPNIQEFQQRAGSGDKNEIEICVNGLYSLFLLRLQKKEISKETLASFSTFSQLLAYLSVQYKKYESGELEI